MRLRLAKHRAHRSLGLSLLPHHSRYDRKEKCDHQQPQEVTDDHPPRRENPKILGQSSYLHDAPPRKVLPCSNNSRGISFPTKIIKRRGKQLEMDFDPSLLSLPQIYGGDFRVFLDPNSISHAIRRAWQAEIFRFHLAEPMPGRREGSVNPHKSLDFRERDAVSHSLQHRENRREVRSKRRWCQ